MPSNCAALRFLPQTDILKLTVGELLFLMEETTLEKGIERLSEYALPMVFVTDGEHGIHAVFQGETIHVPVVPVTPMDTTGDCDAFMAGIIRHAGRSDYRHATDGRCGRLDIDKRGK